MLALAGPRGALAFGFEEVAAKAKRLAAQAYRAPDARLPESLRAMSYDRYRDIRYQPDQSLWRGLGLNFEAAFFHPGRNFLEPVRINEIAGGRVHRLRFDPAQFDYGANRLDTAQLRGLLDYAGFRIHYPVNQKDYKDEIISFLGASYFRALGRGQLYGASARGLAIDTARGSGEEFPRFVEFWIERPAAGDGRITLHGLLDSPRATGAYRFVVTPGSETVVEVRARLFLRDNVALLGLAPLTSMYYFGENQPQCREDYRPEVHDSDGLSIQSRTGEWIWRPLVNPKRLLVTSFAMEAPRGFGLMQRDRDFRHYEDIETHYQLRPSVWVEPLGDWGPGRVELVQIPVGDETNDNVVAYWVPDAQPAPGQPFDFAYRLHWQGEVYTRPAEAWVEQSRRGHGYVRAADGSFAFMVDFRGPALKALPASGQPEVAASTDANGQILETVVQRNEIADTWRLSLKLRRIAADRPMEIRARLRGGDNNKWSEIWSYILPAE